ncbi:MAG: hypothetical protein FJ098_15010 [Deltaproteobacteria bacterium]|nr:hypothetical protein [Deltaproteobacteria bacterium]
MRFAAVLLFLVPASALANPIMMEASHGMQVPESLHVQISYLCENEDPEPGWCNLPEGLEKDGALLTETFLGPEGVTINGGSGLGTYFAWQVCDCDVSPGMHTYKLRFDGDSWVSDSWTLTVTDPPPGPGEPQPVPEGDVNPWDIPEPPWPKGVDCIQWCKDHPGPIGPGEDTGPGQDTGPGSDTLAAGDAPAGPDTKPPADTLAPGNDPGGNQPREAEDAGTCGTGAGPAVPWILLLLAVLSLAWRRGTA